MRKYLLLFTLLVFSSLFAQHEKCGMEAHMDEMMKDPEFAMQWELNQKRFKQAVKQRIQNQFSLNQMDPIVIPVAVHFPGGLESDRACLEALAQNQIDILNLSLIHI